MKITLKGSPTSGWYAPPRGTHSGEKHRAVGSGRAGKKKHILGSSPVRNIKPIPAELRGVNKTAAIVTFEDGTKAIFKPASGMTVRVASVEAEVLAYEFSDSIGWGIVPETVEMTVGDEVGSMQQWVPNSQNGWSYRDSLGVDAGTLVRGREYARMQVMDEILRNPDRNPGNYVVDADERMWAIDNEAAFFIRRDMDMESFKLRVQSDISTKVKLASPNRQHYADAYADVVRWSATPAYRNYVSRVRSLKSTNAADRLEYAVGVCRERFGRKYGKE